MNPVIFSILTVVTIGAALMVILARNPVNSMLFLLLAFFGLASFYIMLGAQFIAAVQIIVYAGAILVLFLFAVMLLNLGKIEEKGQAFLKALGITAGGFLLVIFAVLAGRIFNICQTCQTLTPTSSIGELLFTKYMLPFELASVLLLAAIIGAVVLVKKRTNN